MFYKFGEGLLVWEGSRLLYVVESRSFGKYIMLNWYKENLFFFYFAFQSSLPSKAQNLIDLLEDSLGKENFSLFF